MTKNLKIFLFGFLISLLFWWGVNLLHKNLENFLFWKTMAEKPELLTAQLVWKENLEKLKPLRNRQVSEIEIEAESVVSVFFDKEGTEKILFEKNSDKSLPIASLTKLMTANAALEYYNFNQSKIREILYPLLISSDNRVANELAEILGQEKFVELMNFEAKKIGLENTYFANPSGLDPKKPEDSINYSTTKDLAKFAKYITFERPLIWEISIIPEYQNATNTNELLNQVSGIIGSKTGETPLAGKCLLLLVQAPKNKGFIVNVILNSENRFEEMKKLINWTQYAYKW